MVNDDLQGAIRLNEFDFECPYRVCPVDESGENLYQCQCPYADFKVLDRKSWLAKWCKK